MYIACFEFVDLTHYRALLRHWRAVKKMVHSEPVSSNHASFFASAIRSGGAKLISRKVGPCLPGVRARAPPNKKQKHTLQADVTSCIHSLYRTHACARVARGTDRHNPTNTHRQPHPPNITKRGRKCGSCDSPWAWLPVSL